MNNICVKTNFTAGQISPHLYGRGDLGVYDNGARKLENIIIHPTGGVSRRSGLKMVKPLPQKSRLISFEFNTEQIYLLSLSHKKLQIYKEQELITELDTPWEDIHLDSINWTQSADTLLIVHPDVPPQQISRNKGEVWLIESWVYSGTGGNIFEPYYNFYQHKITLTPNGTTGTITLAADQDVFSEKYIGIRLRINKGEGMIRSYVNPRQVTFELSKNLASRDASADWEEQVFSPLRGYPISVTFHQDRMVVGGSKGLPNHLWLSKSSDLFNFDIGTGLDDEAIDFAILSDQVNAITNIASTRHLLVFTTGAEWMVSGEPLTPSSIQLTRQTNVGSYNKYSFVPQNVDGAILFISQSGRQLREFLYADVEQAYQAKDLTLLSNDIIRFPREALYHQDDSILYVILEDGTVSCLTTYRKEEVNAWSRLATSGKFVSMAVISDDIYFCVERDGQYFLEILDDNCFTDCSIHIKSDIHKTLWSGLEHLEGREVSVVADGYTVGHFQVQNACIELREPASEIIAGLAYEHIIEPLPYMVPGGVPYAPKGLRVIQSIFRLLKTNNLRIDMGRGYCDVPFRNMYNNEVSDIPDIRYTGDVEIHALGWIRDIEKPMWSIKSGIPGAFTLLSAVTEIKIKQ